MLARIAQWCVVCMLVRHFLCNINETRVLWPLSPSDVTLILDLARLGVDRVL